MPETVPTVPAHVPATPNERTAYVITLGPDPTDRDGIARAHDRCAREVATNRDILEIAARQMLTPETIDNARQAVTRLELLMTRIDQLDVMAKTALQAQVDADPDMAGAVVQDDGRITYPRVCTQCGEAVHGKGLASVECYADELHNPPVDMSTPAGQARALLSMLDTDPERARNSSLFRRYYLAALDSGCSTRLAAEQARKDLEKVASGGES